MSIAFGCALSVLLEIFSLTCIMAIIWMLILRGPVLLFGSRPPTRQNQPNKESSVFLLYFLSYGESTSKLMYTYPACSKRDQQSIGLQIFFSKNKKQSTNLAIYSLRSHNLRAF